MGLRKPNRQPDRPSRIGKVHIGCYLPPDYKSRIRLLQAATAEDIQTILARLLDAEFRRHGLVEVNERGNTAA
jgi:hypothetical protein